MSSTLGRVAAFAAIAVIGVVAWVSLHRSVEPQTEVDAPGGSRVLIQEPTAAVPSVAPISSNGPASIVRSAVEGDLTFAPVGPTSEAVTAIAGVVVTRETGAPVPDASVRWVGANDQYGRKGQALTDAAGRFHTGPIEADQYQVTVSHSGHAMAIASELRVEAGVTVEARFELDLGTELVVHASWAADGAAGEPIANALVQVVVAEAEALRWMSMEARRGRTVEARTDSSGTAHLVGLPVGNVLVRVLAEDAVANNEHVRLRPGTNAHDVLVELGGAIAGRVVDDRGGPVEGAYVYIAPDADFRGDARFHYHRTYAVTDGEGQFEHRGLPPGQHFPVAKTREGGVGFGPEGGLAVESGASSPVEITMLPTIDVTGTVSEAEGGVIPGATVELRPMAIWMPSAVTGRGTPLGDVEGLWDSAFFNAVADEDGRFVVEAVPVVPEVGRITVEAQGFVKESREIPGEVIGSGRELNIRLVPLEGTVSGRVVDGAGAPLEGVPMWALSDDPETPLRIMARTDETGRFMLELPTLESGAFSIQPGRLYLSREGLVSDPPQIAIGGLGDEGLNFQLNSTDLLRGYVVDAESGTPIRYFEVAVFSDVDGGFRPVRRVSDEDGRFEIPYDADRDHFARFAAQGYEPVDLRGIEVLTDRETTVQLRPGASLSGRVLDSDGNPVEGARLSVATMVADSPYGPSSAMAPAAASDATGRFELGGVPRVGLIDLAVAGNRSDLPGLMFFEVDSSGTEAIEIELPRSYSVELQLTSLGDEPAAGSVGLFDSLGRSLNPLSEPVLDQLHGVGAVPGIVVSEDRVLRCRLSDGAYSLQYLAPNAASAQEVIEFSFVIEGEPTEPFQVFVPN